jgi:P2 family phage contractile tail tube protein
MAVKTKVNKLTNCNIYIDGVNLLGRAEEITLPDVQHSFTEHKALGMVGMSEFFSGIEKMEASIKWTCLYTEVMLKHSNPLKNVKLMVRGNLQTFDANGLVDEVPNVIYLTCAYKNIPLGSFKKSENVEVTGKLAVYAFKHEIDGDVISEIDVMSNIYSVDGVDILATYRANLGI